MAELWESYGCPGELMSECLTVNQLNTFKTLSQSASGFFLVTIVHTPTNTFDIEGSAHISNIYLDARFSNSVICIIKTLIFPQLFYNKCFTKSKPWTLSLGPSTLRLVFTCGHFVQQNGQFLVKILQRHY